MTFTGVGIPAFNPAVHAATLVDRDDVTASISLWLSSGRLFPPAWLRYELDVDGYVVVVDRSRLGRARQRLTIDGRTYSVVSSVHGTDHLVEVDGVAHRCSRDDAGVVRAPAAALVVAVHVAPGDEVQPGDRIAVVEAMKMEIAITSPVAGRVREVLVAGNTQVDAGAPLVRIDAATDGNEGSSAARPDLGSIGRPAGVVPPDPDLTALRAYVLGFDVQSDDARRRLAATRSAAGRLDESAVLGVLDAVADLYALAPESVGVIGDQADESAATREHFSTYLRTLDVERENVPASFPDRLQRALAWYGIAGLDRSAELEEALSRIFTALARRADQQPVVTDRIVVAHLAACEQRQ